MTQANFCKYILSQKILNILHAAKRAEFWLSYDGNEKLKLLAIRTIQSDHNKRLRLYTIIKREQI